MVTKADLEVLDDTTLFKFRNNVAVPPELLDLNNDSLRAVLNNAVQYLIDNSADLSIANVFAAIQTMGAGLKTNLVEPLTTNANITINNGTGGVYKNSVAAGQELQTLAQINTLISTLTGTNFTLLNGGIQTTDFTVVPGTYYYVSGASGDVAATLPASPSAGDVVGFINYLNDFESNGNVLEIVSASHNVQGGTSTSGDPETLDRFYTLYLIYDTTLGWYRL